MAKINRFLHSAHHLLTGLVLIIKGTDKLSHHIILGGVILFFGIIILLYFFYTLLKKHPARALDLIVHWFEALVALFTAYIFYTEGKKYLPFVFLLAAIGFFIAIYVTHYRRKAW